MLKPIVFESNWITTPGLPDGFAEFLRGKRAWKEAVQPPALPPEKVARVPASPAKSATKTTRPPAIAPKAKPPVEIKPVLMRTGAIAAGPAGYLQRLALQPPAELEDSRSFDDLAREFWASQSIPGQ